MKCGVVMSGVIVLNAVVAFASGFALYEPTTVSHAMGGALVGKAMDASANYNNPATLTDLTNIQVTVGFVTEHPRGTVSTRKNGGLYREEAMDPGLFWLPHVQLAVPLPCDFAFGLGISAEYGLGSQYSDHWMMNYSSVDTTIQGLVINPNIAYKITDDWSVGAGMRWLFFDFEQYSDPYCAREVDFGPYGTHTANFGQFGNRLKGDNGWSSLGWQIGTKYDILDNLHVGAVYKSAIDVDVKGKTSNVPLAANVDTWSMLAANAYGMTPSQMLAYQARANTGDAEAKLRLPQSITAGVNWDVTDTWMLGASVSWTEWSQLGQINFDLPTDKTTRLHWRDTWRTSVGSCWNFHEDWKWLVSYTYDMDTTQEDQNSTMLPPADRHIVATGFAWKCWAGLELALSYSCIFMDGGDLHMTSEVGDRYDFQTEWGYCHAVGFSVTYRF